MIPKIIHFCWFGGNPLPPLALECIASWRKYLPDYEIWEWREEDGPTPTLPYMEGEQMVDKVMTFDVNSIPYTAEAYRQKKYAFVSDYARFWILNEYGGIYFDTDVEVVKPMDDIIAKGCFMGFEVDPDGENTPGKFAPRYCFAVNPGLGFGMGKNHPFLKEMVGLYQGLKFEPIPNNIAWYKTIVAYTTELLCEKGLRNVRGTQIIKFEEGVKSLSGLSGLNGSSHYDITVYPSEYFAPINSITNRLIIKNNTRTIHRYAGSWGNGKKTVVGIIRHYLPDYVLVIANRIKRREYRIIK